MKMRRIFCNSLFAIALVAFVSSIALAQGMFSHPPASDDTQEMKEEVDPHRRFREGTKGSHGKSSGMSRHSGFSAKGLKESLQLDDGQTSKMRSLFREYRKGIILQNAKLEIAQIELEEAFADGDFEIANIEKRAKKKEKAATAVVMVRVKALAKAKDFLSKDQFQKFIGQVAHQMARRKHHGRMGGEGSKHHGSKRGGFKRHGSMGGMMGSRHGESDNYDD